MYAIIKGRDEVARYAQENLADAVINARYCAAEHPGATVRIYKMHDHNHNAYEVPIFIYETICQVTHNTTLY